MVVCLGVESGCLVLYVGCAKIMDTCLPKYLKL